MKTFRLYIKNQSIFCLSETHNVMEKWKLNKWGENIILRKSNKKKVEVAILDIWVEFKGNANNSVILH